MLSQWRSVEATSGRPLTIVLDQAEEAFTRASQEHPEDRDALVIELSSLRRQQGKARGPTYPQLS